MKKDLSAPSVIPSRRAFLKGAGALTGSAALLATMNDGARAAGDPIPVGQAAPLTDFAAADGVEFKNGLEMACEEINALGGILGRPLEPHFEDTKQMGDATNVQAVTRLIDRHGVHAVINGYNIGSGAAIQDVIADSGIVYVHYDTTIGHNNLIKSDPKRYYGSFQGDPAEYWYGPGFLKFLQGLEERGEYKRGNDKMAVILSAGVYAANIANAIKEQAASYGWQISLFETVNVPISEWGPTLAKLREDPPAVIAITHFLPADLAQFMLQFMPNPTQSLVYMQYGPSIPAFREIAKEAANGVLYATLVGALQDEIGNDFEARYKKRFGENAGHNSGAQPYDGCHVWATAAALAGGSGEPGDDDQNRKVADRMRSMIWRGVTGTTRFDPEVQSAYTYPTQTKDPSLGMPHQFLQIQDYTKGAGLIAPPPYDTASFVMPPWIKV
ncbi:amino acid/amide ABC transporter substrate-binding protein, HAAT family [Tistlia consotensis]|uniref:Amino acid/amide ABC transporter substrate-binding protein, HAAT family n=1 Tax=Tistlia consotensis USBA 355 TaxID=560819 RepID=A0A1Y6CC03_9PROT|nr:ABC transporter substrate-binding protein [Tistlia consotensis]SMF55770.1 amino acid/amide ABC transporter substrate-binding protein, HAAT family [Tistlia consotensis USBA 355]SNR89238.1 amino acid/amide ABC transporter substrate-binding protein, HAAT family [Tistlia consotensis]